MVPTTTSLTSLPPELILEVSDFLAPDGILALKLTHRKFNETLPFLPHLKHESFSECAHLAIRTYLSRPSPNPTHLRCILCKRIYPASLFKSSSSPACIPVSWEEKVQQTDVVELPQRLCSWHVGRLARIIHTGPGGRNEWTSHMDEMCMHCGAIQTWEKCRCDCHSCAIRPVRTYTRYLNNEWQCRRFMFWKDTAGFDVGILQDNVDGRLMVRETGWDPGKLHSRNTGERRGGEDELTVSRCIESESCHQLTSSIRGDWSTDYGQSCLFCHQPSPGFGRCSPWTTALLLANQCADACIASHLIEHILVVIPILFLVLFKHESSRPPYTHPSYPRTSNSPHPSYSSISETSTPCPIFAPSTTPTTAPPSTPTHSTPPPTQSYRSAAST
jgi:hypothetical protein